MPVSINQFCKELSDFREQMGLKTFWADVEKVKLAKKAIAITYFEAHGQANPQDKTRIENWMRGTLNEFVTRANLLKFDIKKIL